MGSGSKGYFGSKLLLDGAVGELEVDETSSLPGYQDGSRWRVAALAVTGDGSEVAMLGRGTCEPGAIGSREGRDVVAWFGSSGEWSRDGASLLVMRDVAWWWLGRGQIELCERVGEERVPTVGGMGWRGGRGVHDYSWCRRRRVGRCEQCRGEGGMQYIVPNSLTAFLLCGCTQRFESRRVLSGIEGHGSARWSRPWTGCWPAMTGGPAVASTMQVSIGGAVHAGGE